MTDCMKIKADAGNDKSPLYCINNTNVYTVTNNGTVGGIVDTYILNNSQKITHDSQTCVIISNNCSPTYPTYNCKAICATRSNAEINWLPNTIVWNGAWTNDSDQLS